MLGNLRDKVTRKKRQISFGLTFVNKDKAMSIKKEKKEKKSKGE